MTVKSLDWKNTGIFRASDKCITLHISGIKNQGQLWCIYRSSFAMSNGSEVLSKLP